MMYQLHTSHIFFILIHKLSVNQIFPQFINSSNLGFSTQIPYYNAIDEDKDLTIAPRIYTNNNLFVQTEYRQAFKN